MLHHGTPPSTIINFSKMVPVSDWTMEVQGAKQVDRIAMDDQREITVLLGVTLSGELLPPQIIYAGKTPRCHPNVNAPCGWHATHSENHWSTKETMLEYVDKILSPHMTKQREELGLEETAAGLCIFDIFAAYRCEDFLVKLEENNIFTYSFRQDALVSCNHLMSPLILLLNNT